MIFTLYFLACFGLSFTLAYAKITLPLRGWLAHHAMQTDVNFVTCVECGRVMPAGAGMLCGHTGVHLGTKPRHAVVWLLSWMECVACTGWWIGAISSFFLTPPLPLPFVIWAPFLGFMSLAFNFSLGRITRLID